MGKANPLPDPDGSMRALMLARLEYDIDPRTDDRTDATYTTRPPQKKDPR